MNIKELLGDKYQEDMSASELLSAIESLDLGGSNDRDAELERYKELLSRANSEASSYKKELRAKQTEDEIREAERQAKIDKLQEDYDKLLAERQIDNYRADFLALGYDDKLAQSTAEALQAGDIGRVIKAQRTFLQTQEKRIREELIDATPKPGGGGDGNITMTREQFEELTYTEKATLFNEQPDLYNELNKGV